MVERIKMTPTRILIQDAGSNTKFDTNNYYLKTDPTGVLKAGGYNSIPTVYGFNGTGGMSITDYNQGGLVLDVKGGQISVPGNVIIKVPAYTGAVIAKSLRGGLQGGNAQYFGVTFKSPLKTASFRSAVTNTITLTATFYWYIDTMSDSQLNGYWPGYSWFWNYYVSGNYAIILTDITDFNPPASSDPGQWEFPVQTIDSMTDWYHPNLGIDGGNWYDNTVTADTIAGLNLLPFGIATTSSPVTLSISRTP